MDVKALQKKIKVILILLCIPGIPLGIAMLYFGIWKQAGTFLAAIGIMSAVLLYKTDGLKSKPEKGWAEE